MHIWFVGAANLLVGRVQNIEPPCGTEKLYQNDFGCPSVQILTPALLGVPYFWEFKPQWSGKEVLHFLWLGEFFLYFLNIWSRFSTYFLLVRQLQEGTGRYLDFENRLVWWHKQENKFVFSKVENRISYKTCCRSLGWSGHRVMDLPPHTGMVEGTAQWYGATASRRTFLWSWVDGGTV